MITREWLTGSWVSSWQVGRMECIDSGSQQAPQLYGWIISESAIVSKGGFQKLLSGFFSIMSGLGGIGQYWAVLAESKKSRRRVSNADRKVFAKPESFWNKLVIGWRISGYFGKYPDIIQNIQIICKVSRWTGKFPYDVKCVRII